MRILFVGDSGGVSIAESMLFAARELGHEASLIPTGDAFRTSELRRRISWHLLGRRPPRLEPFSQRVLDSARAFKPDHLVAIGLAPITAGTVAELSFVRRAIFLSEDPKPAAKWFFDALPAYDVVFTPYRRRSDDLRGRGCNDVRYLKYGYDPRYFRADPQPKQYDAYFAGPANDERARFMAPLLNGEFEVSRASEDWSPERVRIATAAARVNICTGNGPCGFEVAAVSGAMLVQESEENLEVFGDDVVYFKTPKGLDSKFRALLADEALRQRLSAQVHRRIRRGSHTYKDRLAELLS